MSADTEFDSLGYLPYYPTCFSPLINKAILKHQGTTDLIRTAQSKRIGAWLSLVERTVRDREVGGSNPLAPTN